MEGLVAGDVVVLDYPFSDLSTTKRRPALVLCVVAGTRDVLLCQITSQFKRDPDAVTITSTDFTVGGLTQPVSNARPNRLITLDSSLLLRLAGRLAPDRLNVVLEAAQAILERSKVS